MSRQHHYLKTETEQFQAVERGKKKFEFRLNDRGYKEFDMVYLQEVVNGTPTGRELPPLEIRHVLYGGQFGVPEKYCVFNW